jgi:glycine/D-amino acid oxidase-like deaminating enzyme
MTGATIKRDLRTGRSLWADSPGLGVPVRPLTAAISVDVAIVGAGISGAFMAHELSKDHSVAVLDRRAPLMGSTLASTALLQWEIDLPLTALAKKIGAANARRAYLKSHQAVDALKRIVAEERIVCGLKDKSSLYLAGDEYGHRALEAEAQARAGIGLDSRYLDPAALRERFGVDRTGALLSSGSASGDPGSTGGRTAEAGSDARRAHLVACRGAAGGQRSRRGDAADRCGSRGAGQISGVLLRV